jgi:DNA-binding NarL/FixJ family response regulator
VTTADVAERDTVVVWHRRTLVRQGLAIALGRCEPHVRCLVADRADDLSELCADRRAFAAIVDLDDRSDAQWDALARLDGTDSLRLIGLYRLLDLDTARRALEVGVRSVVAMSDGLGSVFDALRPADLRAAVFARPRADAPTLEPVERSVLQLVSVGMTVRRIASELGMTPSQVDRAKQQAFDKLGVQHQAHALAVALRHGLLQEPE